MQYTSIFSAACVVLGISSFSCSAADDKPPATCASFDYSKYTATAMPSLATNVMPIFAGNCAVSMACHQMGSTHPPALGGPGATAATISAAIVGVTTDEVTTMKYVVMGQPQNSYLMRKVEIPNPGCGLACTPPADMKQGCSTRMPSGTDVPLSDADIGTIRDWIKQGS